MIITIDGPTASGKSSVAQELAKRLKFHCLSSGMLYRALAYILMERFGYTFEQLSDSKNQDIDSALNPQRFFYTIDTRGCGHVSYDEVDITPMLKSVVISQAASIIAINRTVRDALTALQRLLAKQYTIIVEGRDIGSVVFPHAEVKFFLTASLEVRAQRWQQVQKKRGVSITLDEAKAHIQERDTRDSERAISPLIIPSDAIIVDSSLLNLSQVVNLMMEHIGHCRRATP